MSRPVFAILVISIIAIALIAMYLGWRARSRRDAGVRTAATAPSGALIAEFARVFYISTTPVGEPLVRVAAPGLRYRGRADIEVREDGVTLAIDGEQPVHFAASQLRGGGSGARRVGKAVEQGGLALMRWIPDAVGEQPERELESGFRFDGAAEHERFIAAVDQISTSAAGETPASAAPTATSQEDAE